MQGNTGPYGNTGGMAAKPGGYSNFVDEPQMFYPSLIALSSLGIKVVWEWVVRAWADRAWVVQE
jgi:hypothetical protein